MQARSNRKASNKVAHVESNTAGVSAMNREVASTCHMCCQVQSVAWKRNHVCLRCERLRSVLRLAQVTRACTLVQAMAESVPEALRGTPQTQEMLPVAEECRAAGEALVQHTVDESPSKWSVASQEWLDADIQDKLFFGRSCNNTTGLLPLKSLSD